MNIMVLGEGFLGKAFEKAGFPTFGRDAFEVKNSTVKDKTDYSHKADVIINCIGKSNTRWCEDPENFSEALVGNAIVPQLLSQHCNAGNKRFVHISTGCLYDRNDVPQKETDFLAAHCRYTLSKWVGENYCDPNKDLIIRPRLYFGDTESPNNLICKLKKFDRFLDEQNSYTSIHVIVEAVKALLEKEQTGIFNVACDGYATPWQLAEWMGLSPQHEINEEELHEQQGLYLVNNIMDLDKLKQHYQPLTLEDEFKRCVEALK